MKITILTAGTRGDVQPYIALALGLQGAGHDVKLATGTNFESFVTGYGVNYAPLRADYFELMDSPEGKAMLSGNPLRFMESMRKIIFPLIARMLDDCWQAAQDADMVVYHAKTIAGPHIAERLNIPCLLAMALPIIRPTGAFPVPAVPVSNLGGFFNRLTYATVSRGTAIFNGTIQDWREKTLGLPRKSKVISGYSMNGRSLPVLYGYSRHVIPIPDDWDDSVHVTGYWFLDGESTWQPPADLLAFLNAGDPPVYVGFGSMRANDPERLTRNVIDALQKAGVRAVLATGWGGLKDTDLPPTILRLSEAPHNWLFPRMAGVVHHGGAGTTAAGLRAGKPTMIVPFMVDQPFWGARIHQLGVGPKPIHQKRATADALAEAIRALVDDAGMRQRAEAIGANIRAEDGIANAVQVVERYLSERKKQAIQSNS